MKSFDLLDNNKVRTHLQSTDITSLADVIANVKDYIAYSVGYDASNFDTEIVPSNTHGDIFLSTSVSADDVEWYDDEPQEFAPEDSYNYIWVDRKDEAEMLAELIYAISLVQQEEFSNFDGEDYYIENFGETVKRETMLKLDPQYIDDLDLFETAKEEVQLLIELIEDVKEGRYVDPTIED